MSSPEFDSLNTEIAETLATQHTLEERMSRAGYEVAVVFSHQPYSIPLDTHTLVASLHDKIVLPVGSIQFKRRDIKGLWALLALGLKPKVVFYNSDTRNIGWLDPCACESIAGSGFWKQKSLDVFAPG